VCSEIIRRVSVLGRGREKKRVSLEKDKKGRNNKGKKYIKIVYCNSIIFISCSYFFSLHLFVFPSLFHLCK
jgi:hypothetical protein